MQTVKHLCKNCSLSSHRGVHNDAETFSSSTLVYELQDLLCNGQSGWRAEGRQLLFILLLTSLKTMTLNKTWETNESHICLSHVTDNHRDLISSNLAN